MKNLSGKDTVFVASMLFGMFFGAGNLIFPASMPEAWQTSIDVYVMDFTAELATPEEAARRIRGCATQIIQRIEKLVDTCHGLIHAIIKLVCHRVFSRSSGGD